MDAQVTDIPSKRPRGRQPGARVAPRSVSISNTILAKNRPAPLVRSSGTRSRGVRPPVRRNPGAGRRRNLSRIEGELIRAFAGAATQLQYLNHQILVGDGSEIDLAGYATIASTMLRIGSRLGTTRRAKSVIDLDTFLAMRKSAKAPDAPREGEVIE